MDGQYCLLSERSERESSVNSTRTNYKQ